MRTEDMRKLDFDRLRVAQRDSALNEVKGCILLDRIADAENIEVTGSGSRTSTSIYLRCKPASHWKLCARV